MNSISKESEIDGKLQSTMHSTTTTTKSCPSSPFAGKYMDGIYGFEAKLMIREYNKEDIDVSLMSNLEIPKQWTVIVKAQKEENMPNIGCDGFSQVSLPSNDKQK